MRIVCLTSNGYLRFIPAFAYYFTKFWGRQEGVLVAGYEELPDLSPGFSYFCIGKQARHTWSSGLAVVLDEIDDDWVLLFLEDYLISGPANHDLMGGLRDVVAPHEGAVKVDLWSHSRDLHRRRKYDFLYDYKGAKIFRQTNSWYLMSTWVALWDRKFLLDALRPNEDPWQFELEATKRVGLPVVLSTDKDIVPIVNAHAARTRPLPGEPALARMMLEDAGVFDI